MYPVLSIEEFGHELITSGDLDPVYIALRAAELPPAQLARWLIAYWCFYHVGSASYLSEREGGAFWEAMEIAARNIQDCPSQLAPVPGGRWPRAKERRHFRGAQSMRAVRELRERYPEPEEMVWRLIDGLHMEHTDLVSNDFLGRRTVPSLGYRELTIKVREHRGFGDWIAFKVADMVDRVLGVPVGFNSMFVFFYKDPSEAALWLGGQLLGQELPNGISFETVIQEQRLINAAVEHLLHEFREHLAPPLYDRPIGIQEVETVLCKHKSHRKGHYPLYNDLQEIAHGTAPWAEVSETARKVMKCVPKVPARMPLVPLP